MSDQFVASIRTEVPIRVVSARKGTLTFQMDGRVDTAREGDLITAVYTVNTSRPAGLRCGS